MDNNEQIQLLKNILESNNESQKILRKQLFVSRLMCVSFALIAIALIICIIVLLPKVSVTLDQLTNLVADLQDISTELKETDLAGTVSAVQGLAENSTKLVTDSYDGLTSALEKLNSFDVEGLNTAIEDLGKVVEPLAKLFGKK